jgi:hypothetical protein
VAPDDQADECRIGDHLLGLRGELVLPFQRFVEAVQHLRQAAGRFAGADQADKDLVEDAADDFHRLRERLPALDRLDQAGDHFAEARMLEAVAQVGQTLEDGHAGAHQLLQMEAEVDDFPTRHAAAGSRPRLFTEARR